MTRDIAGLSRACKTLRDGFDSRPRLHLPGWYKLGQSFGLHLMRNWRRKSSHRYWWLFWSGVHLEIWLSVRRQQERTIVSRRSRMRYENENADLRAECIAEVAKHIATQEKLIEVSKEMSALKRSAQ